MKKLLFFSLAIFIAIRFAAGQTVFDFENLSLPEQGVWNGSDESGGFGDGTLFFPNLYDTQWDSWSKFAYSSKTDIETAGYENQYSVYTGSPHSGTIFGLVYPGFSTAQGNEFHAEPVSCTFSQPVHVGTFYVANSTYAALSIVNGDAYNEAFSTTDDDFFKLKITAYLNDSHVGNMDIFLADYTGDEGFVYNTWLPADLSSFGAMDKIEFVLISTNGNDYGMTNPSYFCIDDLTYSPASGLEMRTENFGTIFPNPVVNILNFNCVFDSHLEIFDICGTSVFQNFARKGQNSFNVSFLPSGIYFLRTGSEEHSTKIKFVKK